MTLRMPSFLTSITRALGPVGTVFLVLLLLLILAGMIEPWLPMAEFKATASGPRRAAPSTLYLFGTDNLGRSILARVVEGIRLTFLVSAAAVVLAGVVGSLIGITTAYFRGWTEVVVSAFTNVLFAFPAIIFGLIITSILGPGTGSAVAAIFFTVLPTMIRVSRGAALSVVQRDFVIAAEVSGASPVYILLRHVAPNIAAITVVQMAYMLSIGMIVESALSFLGLGVQAPLSSLGALLRENSAFLSIAPWMVLAPGAVLALLIFSVNILGDTARDIIEPVKPRSLT